MKALILNNKIIQIEQNDFPVAEPLYWAKCPPEVTTEWAFEGGVFLPPIVPEPQTLAELKSLKNAEINTARLNANQTYFLYQGHQVACDPLSRSDIDGINGYVATRGEMPPNWVGGWKAIDNSIIFIPDVPAWNAFYDSMIAQGQANFAKSEGLKAQLAAATTAEQVAAINW
jgi:hypothetical protein